MAPGIKEVSEMYVRHRGIAHLLKTILSKLSDILIDLKHP